MDLIAAASIVVVAEFEVADSFAVETEVVDLQEMDTVD